MLKRFKYIVFIILALLAILFFWFKSLILTPPEIADKSVLDLKVVQVDSSLWECGNSWLHKNSGGIYELYIEGNPFELGVKNGKLTKELAYKQEVYFVNFIKSLIPSETTLNYLRYFITLFNKDLDDYIPLEFRKEIYGVSLFAADEFDFIGEKYHRILNYHAAHDIGHTIQNMNLVNCTAFSIQKELTTDSSLIIGRNLDFSAGDQFAQNKIVAFCKPSTGYKFAYITWGGMIGVLSGMNEHGLTITLNSAKSSIPFSAKSPVCLISRDILQHAKNIDEAYNIISSYESFVSEMFLIGSAEDNKSVVIEKSLDRTEIFDSESSKVVVTNHFQSNELKDTELNLEAINEGCSLYRLERTHELIDSADYLNFKGIVNILRDKAGKNGEDIGIGNEMALNQLICHHSVVFDPQKKIMWVSEFPYQENEFMAYDLNQIFADTFNIKTHSITIDSLLIKPTEFYMNKSVENIWEYRKSLDSIRTMIDSKIEFILTNNQIDKLLNKNRNYYLGYYVMGLYYQALKDNVNAKKYYERALKCEFPRVVDKKQVIEALEELIES